jgi:hypothetical protein
VWTTLYVPTHVYIYRESPMLYQPDWLHLSQRSCEVVMDLGALAWGCEDLASSQPHTYNLTCPAMAGHLSRFQCAHRDSPMGSLTKPRLNLQMFETVKTPTSPPGFMQTWSRKGIAGSHPFQCTSCKAWLPEGGLCEGGPRILQHMKKEGADTHTMTIYTEAKITSKMAPKWP